MAAANPPSHPASAAHGLNGKARPASGHGRPWQAMAGRVSKGHRLPDVSQVITGESVVPHADCLSHICHSRPSHKPGVLGQVQDFSRRLKLVLPSPTPPVIVYRINSITSCTLPTHALSQIGLIPCCRTRVPRSQRQQTELAESPCCHSSATANLHNVVIRRAAVGFPVRLLQYLPLVPRRDNALDLLPSGAGN
jgi:hypothetical protein